MTDLEDLNLFSCGRITDDDVDRLARFSKLKHVDLRSTGVTPGGAERLRKALPAAKVEH